jgi:signal peptidase I
MSSRAPLAATAAWAHLAVVLLSRIYRVMFLTLAATTIVPLLIGAASFVVKSGSMEPSISVGDVVVARPYVQPEKVSVGRVYVFDDPSTDRPHTLVHRIVERRDDGDYTTAGDANEVTDATPLKTDDIIGRGMILVPFIGLPVAWYQAGQWMKLALWLLLTMAAFVIASRDLDGEPPKWGLTRLILGRLRRTSTGQTQNETTDGPDQRDNEAREPVLQRQTAQRSVRRAAAPVALGVALALLGSGLGTANAGFTSRTATASNTWQVASWTQPYVSAVLADSPDLFWLLDDTGPTWAQDRSGNGRTGRFGTGVTFNQAGGLPNNPGSSIRASTGTPLVSGAAVGAPAAHTVEMWVNTTSAAGGYLAGFESSATSNASTPASNADRILRMDTAGRLVYGDWNNNPYRTIATTGRVNDGAWHHIVLTTTVAQPRAMTTIYVDGTVAASGETTRTAAFTGFWHIGGGSGAPALTGRIDNVAIYSSTLPADRVAEHYRVR